MGTYEIAILENSLKYLGRNLVFPKKKDVKNPGKAFYGKFIAINVSTVMFLIGSVLHLIVNIKNQTYINMDLDLALIISLCGSYIFNFSYFGQVLTIIKLYKQLSDFYTFGIPDNFAATNRNLNRFSTYHYVYIISAVIGFCMAPLIEYGKCMQENVEKDINEICGLLGGMWLPFDLDKFPYKQIYYVYQVYSSFVIYQTSSMISFSITETVEHLIVRLRHVSDRFTDALTETDSAARRYKFNNAVQYHVAVIGMTSLVNASFRGCMFVHVLLTGAILGCVGYRLLESYSLGAICLFMGWILSMVIVCISGQRLMTESLAIGESIFKLDWQNLDSDIQKDLIMVILRCQNPLNLQAGPFGYMTYSMILTVLKTSYSYLTLLSRTS